jgi:hypothetical protein
MISAMNCGCRRNFSKYWSIQPGHALGAALGGAVISLNLGYITASSLTRGLSPSCGVHYGFTTLTKKPPAPRLGAGRIFPHSDSSLLHQPQQKHPSEARKRQSTRPRRASCSFGKGDEEIENLIPRRHKPRALLLDHPIKPLDAHRRSGIDDIQREGTDCIRRQRSPSHWRCQRGGILYYIRATVNAVNCDDGI